MEPEIEINDDELSITAPQMEWFCGDQTPAVFVDAYVVQDEVRKRWQPFCEVALDCKIPRSVSTMDLLILGNAIGDDPAYLAHAVPAPGEPWADPMKVVRSLSRIEKLGLRSRLTDGGFLRV